MKHSHEASDGTYGSPRVVRDLMDAGFACSENRVARLMKVAGIQARHKRRRISSALIPDLRDKWREGCNSMNTWADDIDDGFLLELS
ncbi:transposase [Duganella sp. BuS-21]|uniref:transposase n=1 Tax=Duganella sp. BuS-21 TaxID=2943848 RepID=UPI0035A5BFEC